MSVSEIPRSGSDRSAPPGEYLTQSEFARRYKFSERTAERWRLTGEGPPFVRIGLRRVLYRLADCEAWLAERTHADRAAELARRQQRQASK